MSDAEDTPPDASASGARAVGPALESHYRFLLWLTPTVDRFPRRRKFLLGDRVLTPPAPRRAPCSGWVRRLRNRTPRRQDPDPGRTVPGRRQRQV